MVFNILYSLCFSIVVVFALAAINVEGGGLAYDNNYNCKKACFNGKCVEKKPYEWHCERATKAPTVTG